MLDIIHSYRNGGTAVTLHADGTKVRDTLDPAVPPVHPEHMDLKITDWCDAGCAWCHEDSTRRGRHGDVDAMLALLAPLPAGVEIAIGGGDPLSHPEFERLVRGLRAQGLVPSVTVNGRHLDRHLPRLKALTSEGALYGVGVSFFEKLPDWGWPHLVVHMIAGVDEPAILDNCEGRKILLLGYKSWRRGESFERKRSGEVQASVSRWYRALPWVAHKHHISFDTLAIEQMKPRRLFRRLEDFDRHFMGAEGSFGLYVDGVTRTYALSSFSEERQNWTSIQDMFFQVRSMRKETS